MSRFLMLFVALCWTTLVPLEVVLASISLGSSRKGKGKGRAGARRPVDDYAPDLAVVLPPPPVSQESPSGIGVGHHCDELLRSSCPTEIHTVHDDSKAPPLPAKTANSTPANSEDRAAFPPRMGHDADMPPVLLQSPLDSVAVASSEDHGEKNPSAVASSEDGEKNPSAVASSEDGEKKTPSVAVASSEDGEKNPSAVATTDVPIFLHPPTLASEEDGEKSEHRSRQERSLPPQDPSQQGPAEDRTFAFPLDRLLVLGMGFQCGAGMRALENQVE